MTIINGATFYLEEISFYHLKFIAFFWQNSTIFNIIEKSKFFNRIKCKLREVTIKYWIFLLEYQF
jgi:hypothetical protein